VGRRRLRKREEATDEVDQTRNAAVCTLRFALHCPKLERGTGSTSHGSYRALPVGCRIRVQFLASSDWGNSMRDWGVRAAGRRMEDAVVTVLLGAEEWVLGFVAVQQPAVLQVEDNVVPDRIDDHVEAAEESNRSLKGSCPRALLHHAERMRPCARDEGGEGECVWSAGREKDASEDCSGRPRGKEVGHLRYGPGHISGRRNFGIAILVKTERRVEGGSSAGRAPRDPPLEDLDAGLLPPSSYAGSVDPRLVCHCWAGGRKRIHAASPTQGAGRECEAVRKPI